MAQLNPVSIPVKIAKLQAHKHTLIQAGIGSTVYITAYCFHWKRKKKKEHNEKEAGGVNIPSGHSVFIIIIIILLVHALIDWVLELPSFSWFSLVSLNLLRDTCSVLAHQCIMVYIYHFVKIQTFLKGGDSSYCLQLSFFLSACPQRSSEETPVWLKHRRLFEVKRESTLWMIQPC